MSPLSYEVAQELLAHRSLHSQKFGNPIWLFANRRVIYTTTSFFRIFCDDVEDLHATISASRRGHCRHDQEDGEGAPAWRILSVPHCRRSRYLGDIPLRSRVSCLRRKHAPS